ncbi:MFS transporter [Cytobacillus solani]|uniref:MFS transporter n=1 Tax=Cytobacillus solani TaxID=1637975 RepID=UPI0006AB8EF9|nr:MFS transporter [Cytobacillus solani]KOP81897.1 macrolide transporter [Bacillus sp. FJAT-21945]USK56826.1 MFS transporter [Cytobacillus solani]
MKAGMFKPLKIRSFRSLFGAQVFSDLGNWLDFVAIQVIVAYNWGLDASAIASVIIVIGLPWVIVGPFASVFVDRMPKKPIMIVCLLLRILFVGGLFFSPNLYILLVFVFLKGTVAALYDPARQSSIRMTVPDDELPEAVTLSQLSVNTMKIIGPALGGGIIALFGVKSPFIFEAIGFFIAILFLLTMPKLDETTEQLPNVETNKGSYWRDLTEGIRHIAQTRLLKVSIILSSAAFFIIFLYDGLFVFIAKDLGFSEGTFGLLISGVGLGSVVGSVLLGYWTNWKEKPIHLMSGTSVFSGTLIIAIGFGSMGILDLPLFMWVGGAFLLGLLGSGEAVPYGYVLQSETPKQMMGRVSAAAMSIQTFSMLIAPAVGALLAKLASVAAVMIGAGISTCLLGSFVLLFLLKKIRSTSIEKPSVSVKKISG